MAPQALRVLSDSVELRIHVQPQASKNEFAGMRGDRLKVRVRAKPVDGAANEAVRKWIAEAAGAPKSRVEIVRGEASRDKDVRIASENPAETANRLRAAAAI